MATITTNDLKNGMSLSLDDGLFQVVEFQHVKPGKGGAFVRTTLKNVRNGAVVDRTFRAGEKVERAIIDKREMQFLYREGDDYVFMDNQSYEQIEVAADMIGDDKNFLLDNLECDVLFYNERPVGVSLPSHVVYEVTECEPGVKGDTATGASKQATISTGYTLQVPLFIKVGERIKVDTRTGDYLERVNL